MKPGDIVLIRFPNTNLEPGKLRPALIIAITPGKHADLLLALITSRTYQAIPHFDEIIDPAQQPYQNTGLKVPSVIRLARLTTVSFSVINARLGSIPAERIEILKERVANWLREK